MADIDADKLFRPPESLPPGLAVLEKYSQQAKVDAAFQNAPAWAMVLLGHHQVLLAKVEKMGKALGVDGAGTEQQAPIQPLQRHGSANGTEKRPARASKLMGGRLGRQSSYATTTKPSTRLDRGK